MTFVSVDVKDWMFLTIASNVANSGVPGDGATTTILTSQITGDVWVGPLTRLLFGSFKANAVTGPAASRGADC